MQATKKTVSNLDMNVLMQFSHCFINTEKISQIHEVNI